MEYKPYKLYPATEGRGELIDRIKYMILENRLNKIIMDLESKGKTGEAQKKYMELLRQAATIRDEKLRYKLESEIFSRIANTYIHIAEPENALEYAVKALEKARLAKTQYPILLALLMKASALHAQGRREEALETIEEILGYKVRSPVEHEVVLWALLLKARIMVSMKKCGSAREAVDKVVAELHRARKMRYIMEELSCLNKMIVDMCSDNN